MIIRTQRKGFRCALKRIWLWLETRCYDNSELCNDAKQTEAKATFPGIKLVDDSYIGHKNKEATISLYCKVELVSCRTTFF